jgi:hypothetical protein
MAKSGKTSKKTNSKGKKSKQYTKRAGCNNVAPIFFTGGSASPDLPYPINMHQDDPRGGISTRIMPNMTGGKSKRKRKGKRGTRKRISKK